MLVRQECLNGVGFLPAATKYKLFPDSMSLNITDIVVRAVTGVDYVKAIQEMDLRCVFSCTHKVALLSALAQL
jgi:hypothetical protein